MQIFDIQIDKIRYRDFLKQITKLDNKAIIFTPNPEILLKTLVDREYKNLLLKADYLTPDGIWLYIAFQILDNKYWALVNTFLLPYFFFNLFFRRKFLYEKYWDRICGSDLTNDLIKFSCDNWIKVTIIDLYNPTDENKVNSQKVFKEKLIWKFPDLKVDYFIYNVEKKGEIINEISQSDSKILFSTLWMKRQEESVIEIMEKCENLKIGLWIGSSFDYFIWFQKRAPKIWRQLWFEWLYRLITWPRKLDRMNRLFNAIFIFIIKVLVYKSDKF